MEIFAVGKKVEMTADDLDGEEADEKVYTLDTSSVDMSEYCWGTWWVSTMVMSLDPVTVDKLVELKDQQMVAKLVA